MSCKWALHGRGSRWWHQLRVEWGHCTQCVGDPCVVPTKNNNNNNTWYKKSCAQVILNLSFSVPTKEVPHLFIPQLDGIDDHGLFLNSFKQILQGHVLGKGEVFSSCQNNVWFFFSCKFCIFSFLFFYCFERRNSKLNFFDFSKNRFLPFDW